MKIERPECPEGLLKKRLANGRAKYTELGLEKLCPRCGEYYPADTEFYMLERGKNDKLSDWCRACFYDYRIGYIERRKS